MRKALEIAVRELENGEIEVILPIELADRTVVRFGDVEEIKLAQLEKQKEVECDCKYCSGEDDEEDFLKDLERPSMKKVNIDDVEIDLDEFLNDLYDEEEEEDESCDDLLEFIKNKVKEEKEKELKQREEKLESLYHELLEKIDDITPEQYEELREAYKLAMFMESITGEEDKYLYMLKDLLNKGKKALERKITNHLVDERRPDRRSATKTINGKRTTGIVDRLF